MRSNYIQLLFGCIVVVLISVSFLTYRNLNNYTEEVKWVRHSNRVLRAAQVVMVTVRDAETGHRGYQLTRDTTYLEPYYTSLKTLPPQLKTLDSLLAYNEEQKRRSDTLNRLINEQYAIISQILSNARRSSLYMDRYESSLLAEGKLNMDKIRAMIRKISDDEEAIAEIRGSNERDFKDIAPIALLVYSLIALTAVTLLFIRILDALKNRWEAEEKLKDNIEILQEEADAREERELLLNEAEALANMGSWKWDEDTDEMTWSDGLYKIWNRRTSDFIPHWNTFSSFVYKEDEKLMADFLADVKIKLPGSKEDCRIEIDGQIKYISITATVRKTWNSTTNISGIVIDVTTQKLHENRLKQYTAELKRSNEDLEQFAYVASHDLQEPLRKIRAFGDLLTSRYKTQLDVPGADYIQRMQSGAARMQVLIEDLLAFSRVTRLNVLFESLDVNAILAEVIDDIDLQVKRENAAIMVRSIPSFEGDRGQIKRLFQNLVSNAIKFHKRGEQPVVEVGGQLVSKKEAEAELSVVLTGLKYVRIFVKDNGIGFDEQYSERIFNIFQRLHGRMEYEGTGIGLAICRKIVANHGGYITAHSKENAGSEFIIILPVN